MIRLSGHHRRRDAKSAAGQREDHRQHRIAPLWLKLLVLGALGSQSGCSVYQLARRTLYCEPNEYPQVTDAKIACQQYQRWAKKEWQRIRAETGEAHSHDYASGFLQGFIDQVYAGGQPVAPPVPPRKYWRVGYRSPKGQSAVEDWYNGFEHGARVADDGGFRERAVVPSSLTEPMEGSQLERDLEALERTDAIEAEPTPAEPLQERLPPAAPTTGETKTPGLVLPVVFEDSAETVDSPVESGWDNEPPAPPWHAKPQAGEEEDAPGAAEAGSETVFDPFAGSIIQGPGTPPAPDELPIELVGPENASAATLPGTDGGSTSKTGPATEPIHTPIELKPIAAESGVGSGAAEADGPKRAKSTSDEASADAPDSPSEAGDAGQTTDDGWENKLEANEWKSRK